MGDRIKDPFYDVLDSMVKATPPDFLKGIYSSRELSDENFFNLQAWCAGSEN